MKRAGRIVLGIGAVAVFCALAAGALVASKESPAQGQAAGRKERVPVVVTPSREMTFESQVTVSGNVRAKRFALVSARMPGPLDAVYVDEGDRVEAGKTQLFQTDSIKLSKAVAVARQELTVAECSVEEKRAYLEQTLAQHEQASKDLDRYRALSQQNAISAQMFEQQSTQMRQAEAMVKHKRTLIALAEAQLEQARLALTMAEKDLADSLVLAPIDGRVSERMKEPGEMAAPGTPIVKIEDLSVLEVSVHIPEEYYPQVKPGQTEMRIRVGEIDLGAHPVTYKSPTVHEKLRTFEVQGVVENAPEGVVPGCLAEVSLVLDSRSGIGVPTASILQRGDDRVVFTVDGDRARRVTVQTGRDSDGWTECTAHELPAGTPIVSLGQTLLEDGTAVSLVEDAE